MWGLISQETQPFIRHYRRIQVVGRPRVARAGLRRMTDRVDSTDLLEGGAERPVAEASRRRAEARRPAAPAAVTPCGGTTPRSGVHGVPPRVGERSDPRSDGQGPSPSIWVVTQMETALSHWVIAESPVGAVFAGAAVRSARRRFCHTSFRWQNIRSAAGGAEWAATFVAR